MKFTERRTIMPERRIASFTFQFIYKQRDGAELPDTVIPEAVTELMVKAASDMLDGAIRCAIGIDKTDNILLESDIEYAHE